MQSNFQILQSQALMVFICMHWTVFNTSFNGEKGFHLSVLICSYIYWGSHGHYSSLLVIGSFTCILLLYILCIMLITLTRTELCNFVIYSVLIVKFYVQKRDFNKHMYSVFLK